MRQVLAGVGLLLALCDAAIADQGMEDSRRRWSESPHGPMLERILPPGVEAAQLPSPDSPGARLTTRYCVQCHNLPSPAMHHAEKWPGIVDRMVLRMRGRGNMGKLMSEMMAGVKAPGEFEARALLAYLKRNAQQRLDAKAYPELGQPAGEAFRIACRQCHTLPDPKRHSASEWPAVVTRMQRNMEWMNRVVGTRPVQGEPQLRVEEINAFLARYARKAD
ncbi:MAG: hypothetical protein HY017_07185 [Betaproteobacteria bacterium]|nr:hypothetical protein [Betaproteobacteria bacterium]